MSATDTQPTTAGEESVVAELSPLDRLLAEEPRQCVVDLSPGSLRGVAQSCGTTATGQRTW